MRMNLRPVGLTSSTSTSDGNVWLMLDNVTVTFEIVVGTPETRIDDGYGFAGAPVVAPVPEAGIMTGVAFENVNDDEAVPPSVNV